MESEKYEKQIHERGWCVIENVLSEEAARDCRWDAIRIATTCGMIAPNYVHNGSWQTRALELIENDVNPTFSQRLHDEAFFLRPRAINDFQSFLPGLSHPLVMQLLNNILGQDARVTSTLLTVHEPGTPQGRWRATGPFDPFHLSHFTPPYSDAPSHLTLHMNFTDFAAENGGLSVIPQSHRRDENPAYQSGSSAKNILVADEAIAITASAGSVTICDSRLWQRHGANVSDYPCMSLVIDCAPSREKMRGISCEYKAPSIYPGVYQNLSAEMKQLFREWIL